MVFRRPELEKDNPIASQPYVGPRRRRAQARVVPVEGTAAMGEMQVVFQVLTDRASRFVKRLPKTRKATKDLAMLQDAIAQAERLLSAQGWST